MLGHSAIFARETRDIKDALQSSRLSEIKNICKTKRRVPCSDKRHLEVGTAFFHDLRDGDYAGKASNDFGTFKKDHFFKKEAARRAFKTFLKHGNSTSAETTLSTLIRFDAIITDKGDSLSICLQNTRSTDGSLWQCENFHAEVGEIFKIKSNKLGAILKDSLSRSKQLLPAAAFNLLT